MARRTKYPGFVIVEDGVEIAEWTKRRARQLAERRGLLAEFDENEIRIAQGKGGSEPFWLIFLEAHNRPGNDEPEAQREFDDAMELYRRDEDDMYQENARRAALINPLAAGHAASRARRFRSMSCRMFRWKNNIEPQCQRSISPSSPVASVSRRRRRPRDGLA